MRITPIYSFKNYSQPQKSKGNNKLVTPALSNNDVAFTGNPIKGLVSLFDSINPNVTTLERLQRLAEQAQNHDAPLRNAIFREDFKGKVDKKIIIGILNEQKSKAKYTGEQKTYQWLIEHVEKTH